MDNKWITKQQQIDTCVFFYARSSRASRGRVGWKRSPGPDEATPAESKVNCLGSEPPQE